MKEKTEESILLKDIKEILMAIAINLRSIKIELSGIAQEVRKRYSDS